VVVCDLYIEGVTFSPLKADSPLIIDANAKLPRPIPQQFFQPICGRDSQVVKRYRIIDHAQLPQGNLLNSPWQSARKLSRKDLFCFSILERLNHGIIV
jgi:hypothetical protein